MKKIEVVSLKKVAMHSCHVYEGNLIKVIGMGTAVVEVVDLNGRRFEAAIKHFKKPSMCKHEVEGLIGTCFHKDHYEKECKTYFCNLYGKTQPKN